MTFCCFKELVLKVLTFFFNRFITGFSWFFFFVCLFFIAPEVKSHRRRKLQQSFFLTALVHLLNTASSCFLSLHRNLLYSLPGTTPQFSILRFWQQGALSCGGSAGRQVSHAAEKDSLCHGARNQSLALVLRALRSAQTLVRFGLDLFENYPGRKWILAVDAQMCMTADHWLCGQFQSILITIKEIWTQVV